MSKTAVTNNLLKRVVVDSLSRNREVLPAWQRILLFVVTHPCLAPPLVEVVVRLVDVDTKLAKDAKIFSLETVLLIDGVTDIQMMLMAGAFAGVPSKEYLRFVAKWQIPHPP